MRQSEHDCLLELAKQSSFLSFFFLDEKETKNQDLDFRPSTSGSLPKTQKLARSFPHGLRQLVFLNESFTQCPDTSGGPAKSYGRKSLRRRYKVNWNLEFI
jgi:hypothetical protein